MPDLQAQERETLWDGDHARFRAASQDLGAEKTKPLGTNPQGFEEGTNQWPLDGHLSLSLWRE
jgi:hypothetical protein